MPQLVSHQRVEAMAGVGLFAAMDADQWRAAAPPCARSDASIHREEIIRGIH